MEKLKFWLDELDLIAKEFNREYEQLCKEHLTRLQKINMELDEGSPEHIFACEYYYNLLDNRLESLRSLGQFYMLSVTKMDEVLKKSRENENPVKKTIRKTIDNFMESIENLMKLQNGLKGYLMSRIDSVKSIKPEMQKMMNEFETKKLVKIPEGWDFLEVDDEYNVIVAREKKGA